MAQALLWQWIESGQLRREAVRAVVGSAASADRLARDHGLAVGTDPAPAWQSPVLLLAVKPQQLAAAAIAAGDAAMDGPPAAMAAC